MGQICSWFQHDVQPLQNLTAEDINIALRIVADHLWWKRKSLVLVVVWGAINTLYLRSRTSTHDVDFISRNLSYEELKILDKATQNASTAMGAPVRWLNNQTSVFLTHDVRLRLVAEAIAANIVIFQHGRLTLLVAPWRYLLCTKLDRIHQAIEHPSRRRDYDIDDAAAYLNCLVAEKGGPISRPDIVVWLEEFELSGVDILDQLNEVHMQTYGAVGVV